MLQYEEAVRSIRPLSAENLRNALNRQSILTKPPGALGMMEAIANRFSGISSVFPPSVPVSPVVCVFASDHGVLQEGISPWPQEVTMQMVANFVRGGAAINAIAKQVGAKVVVVDVGVAGDLGSLSGLAKRNVRSGTDNLALRPAMSLSEACDAIQVGFEVATAQIDAGADILVMGDMGIGNTTPSAALISWFTGAPIEETTGRGTGIDDERMVRKISAIKLAHARLEEEKREDPVEVLASVGGLEIAALVGLIFAGASRGIPVVLDGVIADAAAVVAFKMNSLVVDYLFAGHLSSEPGARKALDFLGLEPILKLDLRLGEGTGACLAVPVIQASVRTLIEMATFGEAGVSEA